MMNLKLFNTQTRQCEELRKKEDFFGIYCCGPTVYGPAHIGNFRTYVVQDTVLRILNLLNFNVKYVRNLTDVDDKTIRGASEQHQSLRDYTQYWINIFNRDCQRLNLLPPSLEPRATETIQEQQALIQLLIEKGHAYVRNGSVYFRINSFKDYGKLSRLELNSLKTQEQNSAGLSNDADEYDREQVADFALWKAYKAEDGEVFWESPWGKGRPGWHIECSAMSHLYLGKTVDLHAGGIDLCFPHHENEIAQSEAAYGSPFVHHWLHIAHLKVEGQKMSKSLGNLLTLDMLQEKNYASEAVRYALLAGHYRQSLNFTFDLLQASRSALQKIQTYTLKVLERAQASLDSFKAFMNSVTLPETCLFLPDFFESLLDDLNVPKALGCLFSFMHKDVNVDQAQMSQFLREWAACLYSLGIVLKNEDVSELIEIPLPVRRMAEQRWIAKQALNFKEADDIRHILEQSGWKILDSKESYKIIPMSS